MQIRCLNLGVDYEINGQGEAVIDGLSFETKEGEFLSVIGPSGCGKTTLLRTIAGFKSPSRGSIKFMSQNGDPAEWALLVRQENSLFPWMTAIENAAFGLEMVGVERAERERRAVELLERHGLGGRETAYPYQLSAGMKQRVAVIRAFLSNPPLLLMDEPFGALDGYTRRALQRELLDLWRGDRKSVIFVTHDVDEAIVLSDRILVLGGAPGPVLEEVVVSLPRGDRHSTVWSDEFIALKREIQTRIEAHTGRSVSRLHPA